MSISFTMNCDTFEPLLKNNNIRWFDIVLYNYIKSKTETIGVYCEDHKEYDKETKTTSNYKDVTGFISTDLQMSKVLQVKGSEDTAKKEISKSLGRLEKSGAIKREYIKMNRKELTKQTRIIVPLV